MSSIDPPRDELTLEAVEAAPGVDAAWTRVPELAVAADALQDIGEAPHDLHRLRAGVGHGRDRWCVLGDAGGIVEAVTVPERDGHVPGHRADALRNEVVAVEVDVDGEDQPEALVAQAH